MSAPKTDRAGIKQIWKALVAADYKVIAVDAEDDELITETADEAADHIMTCDDGAFRVEGPDSGWVWFVFGNSPEEVVADHSVNLSPVIDPVVHGWW